MRTYLFDFDGTLVDSMPTFCRTMLSILDEGGIKYGDDITKIITPLGYSGTADYFIKLGLCMPHDAVIAKMHGYARVDYRDTIPAKPNVIEVLTELRARGCSLNVLTASPHEMLDLCLMRLGIFGLFDNVWSCDDFGTTKTNPEIYKMAAARLGVSVGEVTFLDDNPEAGKTAKSAGMRVIGVFDGSSSEFEDEMRAVCDGYIHDFKEVLEE